MSLPVDHRAGTQLGPFLLGNVVGQGGMGVVYSATRIETGETVALKLMAPELSSSEEFRQRFLNEAAVGPIMDHPNVVPIYGSGEVDGELYIAMKLIDGRNLKEVLKDDGPLEPKRALKILRQVASALDAAHESGMVHRDIKPQNILLATDDGQHDLAYVSDFGLVKPMSSDTSASRTGQVFGSLPYMAPEQIEAMEMDGRADVYALACVLFEALTGRPPFERPNEVAVVWAHVHEQPPFVSELKKELPGGIDGVVMQALSKHPDDRFLTCGEFVEAFEQGLGRQRSRVSRAMRPLVARTERPKTEREVWGPNFFPELSRIRKVRRRVDWMRAAAALGALSLVAMTATQLAHSEGLSGAASDVSGFVESTTGNVVELVTGEGGETDAGDSPPLPPAAAANIGAGIGRSGAGTIVSAPDGRESRDSAASEGSVAREETSSGSKPGNPHGVGAFGDLRVAFASTRAGLTSATWEFAIYTVNADGTELEGPLTPLNMQAFDPDLSRDGSKLLFTGFAADSHRHVFVADSDGSNIEQMTFVPGAFERDAEWSSDGRRIVFARWLGDQNSDLYLLTKTSSGEWQERRLTETTGEEGSPEFSPDGRKIAYDYTPDQDNTYDTETFPSDIFIMKANGEAEPTNLTNTPTIYEGAASWSPDGQWISHDGSGGVWITRADGLGKKKIADGNTYFTDWSPDGSAIAFQSCGRAGQFEECEIRLVRVSRPLEDWVLSDAVAHYDGMPEWGPASTR